MELKFCSQAQSQAQAETRAQTWIVMQVAYINRRAFMQLLIKTTNVMTNFKNKTVFNFALPCRYPLPVYRSACLLPPPFLFHPPLNCRRLSPIVHTKSCVCFYVPMLIIDQNQMVRHAQIVYTLYGCIQVRHMLPNTTQLQHRFCCSTRISHHICSCKFET